MFHNFLTSLRSILLAMILSIGISYAYATWAPPTETPPSGNIDVPVNVGTASQTKTGFLWANGLGSTVGGYFSGAVGIGGITPAAGYMLDVAGKIHASDDVCTDLNGGKCLSATGGGGGTITGVIAGTGLTGGGTSGNVTLNVKEIPTQKIYQCPTILPQDDFDGAGGGTACPSSCDGQLSTNSSCSYTSSCSSGGPTSLDASAPCTFLGYIIQP